MKTPTSKIKSSQNGLPVLIGAGLALAVGAGSVAAQTGGSYSAQQSSTQRSSRTRNQTSNSTTTTVSSVIAQMAQYAGVQILADRNVANYPVTAPTEQTTAANIDSQIKALVAQLPSGAVSGKFYLPAASTTAYTADNVEAFAMAESRLFGPVGGPQATGTVEVLGQKLTSDKATAVIADLNLQPIYLIGNPSSSQQSQSSGNYSNSASASSNTSSGSGLNSQAQQLLNMPASQRDQALLQMASDNQQTISQVLQNVPASERQQLLQSLRSSSSSSSGSSSGFGGGGGGGGRHGGGPGGQGGSQQ